MTVYCDVPREINIDDASFSLFDNEGITRFTTRLDHRYFIDTTLKHFSVNNFSCQRQTILSIGGFNENLDDEAKGSALFDRDTFARLTKVSNRLLFDRNITICRVDHKGDIKKTPALSTIDVDENAYIERILKSKDIRWEPKQKLAYEPVGPQGREGSVKM